MIKTLNVVLAQEEGKTGNASMSINGFNSLGEAFDVAAQILTQSEVKKALDEQEKKGEPKVAQ